MNIYTGLTFMSFVFCISTSSECSLKNISCSDIKTDGGFTFPHECPQGSEIEVFDNGTLVALAGPGIPKTKLSDKKIIIGNDSVVTRNCRDLKIKCFVPVKNDTVKKTCLDYKVTGMPNPDPVQPPTKENDINALTITLWVLGGPFVGASVLIVVVMVWLCCCKNKSSGVPWDLQYLRSCLINNISQTQNNGDIRLSEISATDPRGSGGSDGSGGSGGSAIEHGNTLESVHSHRLCCHVKNYLSKPSLSKVFHTIIRSLDCNLLKAPFVSTVSMPRLLSPLVWTATPPHRESRRLKVDS